jgi:SlyX protein
MSDTETLAARVETLEIRAAHQDRAIEDLNKVVTEQWAQIETLKRRLNQLLDRVQEIESNPAAQLPEPPPPHY